MAYDFKKEYRKLYAPKNAPEIIDVPEGLYLCVDGKGNPNDEAGEYKRALEMLYSVSYTIKMSYMGSRDIEGFFQYVVPPLEGLWEMKDMHGVDYSHKEKFVWTAMLRQPEFVTEEVLAWAKCSVFEKKKIDASIAHLSKITEGLCVQCMHFGTYDDEPATIAAMKKYTEEQGCEMDYTEERRHHEIYLGDPRKCAPEKLKTVIRLPVKAK